MSNSLNKFLEDLYQALRSDKLVLPTLPEMALKVREVVSQESSSLAERIRAGIEACTVEELQGRRLTVSIGVAGLQGEEDIAELIHHADQALYIAKSSGRNRCILFHDKQTPASRVRRNEQPVLQG
jgi:diguanylate cyclase (GGDEF)-like protein